MFTDSSRVTRSAGSATDSLLVSPGSGSGTHSPTYRSRRTRAERSWSRQIRLATFVSQAAGLSMASRSSGAMAYQRAYVSCTASSASTSEPSSR